LKKIINHSLFSGFDDESLKTLLTSDEVKDVKYPKGSYLHLEGDICSSMDILIEGELEIQRIDEQGGILTVTRFYPVSSLGENLLFGDNNIYPMSAFCSVDSRVIHLSHGIVLKLCQEREDFLLELLKNISNKAIILTDKIKMITNKSLRERINNYLYKESLLQKSCKIRLRSTKKEIAQILGVQRTSFSRELSKMRKEGVIEFDKDYIIIKTKVEAPKLTK
jgi:CRP/FNR family transcriptional regulator, dissimilatory nitrate respiration regulator